MSEILFTFFVLMERCISFSEVRAKAQPSPIEDLIRLPERVVEVEIVGVSSKLIGNPVGNN